MKRRETIISAFESWIEGFKLKRHNLTTPEFNQDERDERETILKSSDKKTENMIVIEDKMSRTSPLPINPLTR